MKREHMEEDYQILIHKFLEENLTEEELALFKEKFEQDEAFAAEVKHFMIYGGGT